MESSVNIEISNSNDEVKLSGDYDTRWGWFVLFGAFVILTTFGCIMYTVLLNIEPHGINMEIYEYKYIYPKVTLSIFLIICYNIAPLTSLLIKLFGFRGVSVVGSILAGISMLIFNFDNQYLINENKKRCIIIGIAIGFGLMYLSAITSVITYFKKFRPLAIGIAICGLSEITILYNLRVFNVYASKETVITLTVVIFMCCLCSLIFRPLQIPNVLQINQNHLQNSTEFDYRENTELQTNNISKRFKEWTSDMISVSKNSVFIFFVVIWTCFSIAQHMAYNCIVVNLKKNSRDQEFVFYLYAIALSGLFGRILFGLIFSLPQLIQHRYKMFSLAIVAGGVASALIIPCNNNTLYILCIIVIFVLTSGSIGMIPVIVADLMTPKLFSSAYSLLLFSSGFIMLNQYKNFYLIDNDRNEIPLIILSLIISLCGLILFFIPSLQLKLDKYCVNKCSFQTLY